MENVVKQCLPPQSWEALSPDTRKVALSFLLIAGGGLELFVAKERTNNFEVPVISSVSNFALFSDGLPNIKGGLSIFSNLIYDEATSCIGISQERSDVIKGALYATIYEGLQISAGLFCLTSSKLWLSVPGVFFMSRGIHQLYAHDRMAAPWWGKLYNSALSACAWAELETFHPYDYFPLSLLLPKRTVEKLYGTIGNNSEIVPIGLRFSDPHNPNYVFEFDARDSTVCKYIKYVVEGSSKVLSRSENCCPSSLGHMSPRDYSPTTFRDVCYSDFSDKIYRGFGANDLLTLYGLAELAGGIKDIICTKLWGRN